MKNDTEIKYFLTGFGWFADGYTGSHNSVDSGMLFDRKLHFKKEFKNFGRLDEDSRVVCAALSSLLGETGLYPSQVPLSYPVLFTSTNASMPADIYYFRDFISFGEMAGRANLFVYTLPTSPLGEASVHFGLTGPLLFTDSSSLANMITDYSAVYTPSAFIIGFLENKSGASGALFMSFSAGKNGQDENLSSDCLMEFSEKTLYEKREYLLKNWKRL